MQEYHQGDLVRIGRFTQNFVIVSNNSFIRATGMFHVCPFLQGVSDGPLHISAQASSGTAGTAILEQIKLIDPEARPVRKTDHLFYRDIMELSDALQGMFDDD